MKVGIAKIKSNAAAKLEFDFVQGIDAASYGYEEFSVVGAVSVSGSVVNLGAGADGNGEYRVELGYKAELEQVCSRCGKSFSLPVQAEMSARFVDGTVDNEDGEEEIYFITDGQADVAEPVLSDMFFALPMQPLCREDCKGLCPKCGADLNLTNCSCERFDIDPRWEKLKNFLPTED